ncbi:MAG: creatininase family protein [Lentisphaeria bacterium]|jgi:creatinine amidohydrolase|nr:creatininase family protein [Lentisphaeria bacterium]
MRYELMRPHQIRRAIDENWPVLLPLGVLEYHAEHLPVGMDTLAVERCFARLEEEMNVVVLPTFYYGSASFAVAPPERNGSIHVDSAVLCPFAEQLFAGLLRVGFRNIHFFIHHQSENFAAGMPTDLAFKFAARRAIFAFLEAQRGEGWWGDPAMANYYEAHAEGSDPFSWIQGHPLMDEATLAAYPFDHAGQGETSLMMALCPDTVAMDRHSDEQWYAASAVAASAELGEQGVQMILAHLRRVLA